MAFALARDLSAPSIVSINIDISFAAYGNKIRLLIAEVLLRAAAGDLTRSEKQRDWTPPNAVLFPPFFTEATILHGELDTGKLLNIFAHSIMEWVKKGETASGEDGDNNEDSEISVG